ncbi:hypothetical protein PILCRDRAFT_823109 [Piloderma croceum F 1598]|uniref:Uncharacterized protein n=1 Tax=Piloderma croceum (strain F 1598) TaxID=765440 RepID=A0A0C3B016_PILCF|nr:hypothetical protein PILCRDRAFT_823109 [Piloderma croceum F 1598]
MTFYARTHPRSRDVARTGNIWAQPSPSDPWTRQALTIVLYPHEAPADIICCCRLNMNTF